MRAAIRAKGPWCFIALGITCAAFAQDPPIPQLKPGSARKLKPPAIQEVAPLQLIDLTVPKGTPIQVALEKKCACAMSDKSSMPGL